MKPLFLLIGSNLGNRKAYLEMAINLIDYRIANIAQRSSVFETAPWGNTEQPHFLNQVLMLKSNFHPEELLMICKNIEKSVGRVVTERWGPRIIDIDILLYGDMTYQSSILKIPHPMMQDRMFTMVPLAEIAPDFIHPVLGENMKSLKDKCTDPMPTYPLDV
jgi:2-amino-4-hydroxy-6-hydroxymethyldihydropteridine diphosphokinase